MYQGKTPYIAAGRITGATGAVTSPPASEGSRHWTAARTGAGDYLITFDADNAIAATERVVDYEVRTAARLIRTGAETATTLQVLTTDLMGAAADSDFGFSVSRLFG
jgi:hypothetical protein